MKTAHTVRALLWAAVILLAGSACREKLVPETPDYTEYGWELWIQGDYAGALQQFDDGLALDKTYADTWNGLGWTYIQLGIPDKSESNFIQAIIFGDTTEAGSEVGTEALAGRAFARLALGEFTTAVSDAKEALIQTPLWIFKRDISLTYEDLMLTVATGFYGQAEFDSSLVWVKKLDATFNANVSTLAGRSALAAKLQDLASGS